MRIFVDTNILLDTIVPERQGAAQSRQILNLSFKGRCKVCLSSLSLANISYITRKQRSKEQQRALFKTMLDVYHISPVGDFCAYEATHSSCPDFEDALQISAAELDSCEVIITRDKKHFEGYTALPVFSPDEFLEKIRRS